MKEIPQNELCVIMYACRYAVRCPPAALGMVKDYISSRLSFMSKSQKEEIRWALLDELPNVRDILEELSKEDK